MTAEFFALAGRGDPIYDESVVSGFKIMTLDVNLPGVFVGGGCNLPRPLFLPSGIIQVRGIGSESIFRRKIDKDSEALALVHLHGNRSGAASADVDGSPGADLRLIRSGYQARIRNEALVPDHRQEQGEDRYGECGTQPCKPSRLSGFRNGNAGHRNSRRLPQNHFRLFDEHRTGAQVERAILAVKEVLLELIPKFRLKLVKKVFFRGFLSDRLIMVHIDSPHNK